MEKTNPLHPFWYDQSRPESENALAREPIDRRTRDENAGGTRLHTRITVDSHDRYSELGRYEEDEAPKSNQLSKKRSHGEDNHESFKRRTFGLSSSGFNSDSGLLSSDDPAPVFRSVKNSHHLMKTSSGPGSNNLSSESVYYFQNRVPSSPPVISDMPLDSSPGRMHDENFFTSQATVIPADAIGSDDSDRTIDFNVDFFNRVNAYFSSDYLQDETAYNGDTYNDELLKENARSIIANCIFDGNPRVFFQDLGLKKLPDDIGDLDNMTVLGRNGIEVPNIEIYAGRNLLRILPPPLFNIKNLTVLSLRNNKLKRLPGIISKLKKLVELNIVTNELKVLPYQILDLPNLRGLTVRPNMNLIELKDQDPSSYFCVSDQDSDSDAVVKRYVSKIKWIDGAISNHHQLQPHYESLDDKEMLHYVSPLPRLKELALRRISKYQVTRSETLKWKRNIPTYIQRMIAKALQKGIFEETCSTCKEIAVNPIAKSLEWWDFKTQKLIPIRHNFCCGNCVQQWMDTIDQELHGLKDHEMDIDEEDEQQPTSNTDLRFDEEF